MQTGHPSIEYRGNQQQESLIFKAGCIIGTGVFCACFVLAVLS